jgi:hypothetical protein
MGSTAMRQGLLIPPNSYPSSPEAILGFSGRMKMHQKGRKNQKPSFSKATPDGEGAADHDTPP